MRLLKNAVIYSGLGFLDKGIGIILLPVYTRYLTPGDYGTVTVVDSITSLLVLLYPLGASASLLRSQFTLKNPDQLKILQGTLFTFLLGVGFLGTVLFSIGREYLLQPFVGSVAFWPFLAIGLLSAWFQPVQEAYLSILQAREDASGYLRQAGGASLLRILLVLTLVVGFKLGAVGLLVGIVTPYLVFSTIALWKIRNHVVWGIDREVLLKSLKYSLPVIPHFLAGWVSGYFGILVLNQIAGAANVGVYGLAARFALIVGFVVNGLLQALQPQLYSFLASDRSGLRQINQKVAISVSIFASLSIGISLFAEDLVAFLATPAFYPAIQLVPILAFSQFVRGNYACYANALYYEEKGPRYLPLVSISAAVLTVVSLQTLIPKYAETGMALSTLIGTGSSLVLVAILANFKAQIFWNQYAQWFKIVAALLFSLLAMAMTAHTVSFWIRVVTYFVALACFSGPLFTWLKSYWQKAS
jgi:O-antigen/teichoic acid export membrane protein